MKERLKEYLKEQYLIKQKISVEGENCVDSVTGWGAFVCVPENMAEARAIATFIMELNYKFNLNILN